MLYESKHFDRNTEFSPQFEALIDAEGNGGDDFVVSEAVKHLNGLLINPPKRSFEARLVYLGFVDRFFGDYLMAFDEYPGLWRENACEIEDLIDQAERTICARLDIKTAGKPSALASLRSFRELMTAYRTINDAFLGKYGDFKAHLEETSLTSQANVQSLVEDCESSCPPEGWREKIELASRPLVIVARADLEGRYAQLLTETLCAYKRFLKHLDFDVDGSESITQTVEELFQGVEAHSENLVSTSEGVTLQGFLPQWGAPRLREYAIFGRDHGEPLKWVILEAFGGRTHLLSEKVLDVHAYTEEDVETCAWEDSCIREWVNSELIYDLFTSSERAYIDGEPRIMTASEIRLCYPRDEDSIAYPTTHALSRGLKPDSLGAVGYWTSTPGEQPYCMAYVRPDGDINMSGYPQDDNVGLGVRLAITLKVDVYANAWCHQMPEESGLWDDDCSDEGLTADCKQLLSDRTRAASLSNGEASVLQALSDLREARVSELAEYVDFPVSSIYNLLARLETKGLVEKTAARKRHLTPEGAALLL